MKQILIFILLITCSSLFGQVSPSKLLRVGSSIQTFSQSVSPFTVIIDTKTGEQYMALLPLAGTKTIETCTETELQLIASKFANITQSATGLSDVTASNPVGVYQYTKLNSVPYNEANQDVNLGTYNITADSIFGVIQESDPKYKLDSAYIKGHVRTDADLSVTNEIQEPTLTGNDLGLTGTTSKVNIASAPAVVANTAKVSSQWTNQTNGIKYTSNVGIGADPLVNFGLYVENARPAFFKSTSLSGESAAFRAGTDNDEGINSYWTNLSGAYTHRFFASGNVNFAGGLILGLWNGSAPTGALRNSLGTPQYYNGSTWVNLAGSGGSMVYPGAGIAVSTGSAWGASLTDNTGNWNAAYNDKINFASFSTSTGVVTLTQQDAGTVTVDIDGRYLESVPDNYLRNDANDVTTGSITATNFILSSDQRLKENIQHIHGLDWCDKVKFVQFNMKKDTVQRYGVIAQQIEKLNPNMVYTDKDGMKSVAYIDLIIAKLASMEERITILESETTRLKDQIKRLKNRRK